MINDLSSYVLNSSIFKFADDTNLIGFCKISEATACIQALQDDLNNISKWLESNHVELNCDKTVYMVVGKKQVCKIVNPNLTISNTVIKRVSQIKTLGVILDENMTFLPHANRVISLCYGMLGQLYPIRFVLNHDSRKKLAESLILSKLRYCNTIWLNKSEYIVKLVNRVTRATARFVLCKRKYDHITADINFNLEWLNCKFLYKYDTLVMIRKLINGCGPNIFLQYFSINDCDIMSTSTRGRDYHTPNLACRREWGQSSFRFNGLCLWMNLPIEIKETTSITLFKKLLYSYLLTEQINQSTTIDDEDNFNLNELYY